MNLLTVIVLIIFALFLLRGYRRGFLKSLASMTSLVLSLVLVNFATPYVTEFLKDQTPLYDYILEKCEMAFAVDSSDSAKTPSETYGVQTETTKNTSDTSKNTADSASKTVQDQLIDALPLPKILRNLLKEHNTAEYYQDLAAKSFSEYVPRYMATLILNIASYIVTFLLVSSFIGLLILTMDVITSIPIIHGINQILGLALGFLQALVLVWVLLLLLTVFSSTDVGTQLMKMVTESPILNTLYNSNVLLDFLQGIMRKFA